MKNLHNFGLIALLIVVLSACAPGQPVDDIDLATVLDITVDTIESVESKADQQGNQDQAFVDFASALEANYNQATPALYSKPITVQANADSSLIAYVESNSNGQLDKGEEALFLIEVDGENSRIIATSRSGAVNDHRFSGTGFLTGYLIASMLSRQRAAGVNPNSLAAKKTVTAKQAARSRAGSGSYSRGK